MLLSPQEKRTTLKLVLLENPGRGGSLNHLGVEVDDTEAVEAHLGRLNAAGFHSDEERNTTCCYAVQDKFWITAPDGERWEHYTVLADAQPELEGATGDSATPVSDDGTCCASAPGAEAPACC